MTMLLSGRTTDGSGSWIDWPSGLGTVRAYGAFNGATVKLEMLGPDGTTAIPVGDDASFTAAGMANFSLGPCKLRGTVSNASGSTNVSLAI